MGFGSLSNLILQYKKSFSSVTKYMGKIDLCFFVISSSTFLSDPGVPGVRSMGPDLSHSKRFLQT